jgi:inner membrane protein
VAFFAPFDETRYFFPFHPIMVTPLEPARALGPDGLAVLVSEAMWVWILCAFLVIGRTLVERSRKSRVG